MAENANPPATPEPSPKGHLRVVYWFGCWGVLFLALFLSEFKTAQPNWLLLAALILAVLGASFSSIRDLLKVRAGSTKESTTQIALAVGAAAAIAAILYFAWKDGPTSVVRIMDACVIPALVVVSLVFAAGAWHVERKHKVRVYVGNRGWLYLPLPSNTTVERDARNDGARPSP